MREKCKKGDESLKKDEICACEATELLANKAMQLPYDTETFENKSDDVDHPEHYTNHPSDIECIEIVRHMGFNLGNAIKYIWRCELKKDLIKDLEKAIWYIKDEIEMRKNAKK